MKSIKVILLIILFFFIVINWGISSDEADKRSISTPEWIFKVTSFKSGLQEAKWGQRVLFSTRQDAFKDNQFIRIDGLLRPALKKDKYIFDFKLKLNGEQNLILVEMVDKEGKSFVAMGDEARFDRSRTIEFKSNQFPMKMGICFYLPGNIQSIEFSIDDSPQLKLNGM